MAAQASPGNGETQAQAELAIANASPGGKHQKLIPDIGTWPFNSAKCFHNILSLEQLCVGSGLCVVTLTSHIRRQRLVVNGKDIVRAMVSFLFVLVLFIITTSCCLPTLFQNRSLALMPDTVSGHVQSSLEECVSREVLAAKLTFS